MEVPDDRAGVSLQCPLCRRLVDVPHLSDLGHLTDDGSYKIDELELREEPERLPELYRAFAPTRVDESGNDIDLRHNPDRIQRPVQDDDVLEMIEDGPKLPPKYDPVTGELIREIEIKDDGRRKVDPSAIPMAQAVINYATGDTAKRFSGWKIIPELFKFQNAFVMMIIFVVHVFLQIMMFPLLVGIWIILPGFFFLVGALIAHYANVVGDIGPDNKDELPRPGRDLSWYDDLWNPFIQSSLALGLCYGPLAFIGHLPPNMRLAFAGTILIIGTVAFPAIYLTTTTSGTVMNLAPDKLLRVISTLGIHYFFAVGLWVLSAFVYMLGIGGTLMALSTLLDDSGTSPVTTTAPAMGWTWGFASPWLVSYPLLVIGIVMMHAFCWYIGLQYREYYENFDWYLQRHHKKIEVIRSASGLAANTRVVPAAPPPIAKQAPQPVIPAGPAGSAGGAGRSTGPRGG